MIGRLTGTLIYKKAPELLLDVNGVGYEIQASMTTFYQLPDIDQPACLYTQLIVREDAHTLFGFNDLTERELFRALIKVNSVGPKLALTILSSANPDEFCQTVLAQDTARLSKIPGIGKKTAERLIIELRDKVTHGFAFDIHKSLTALDPKAARLLPQGALQSSSSDAISALINLGYSATEATRAITLIPDTAQASCETLIKAALKSLA